MSLTQLVINALTLGSVYIIFSLGLSLVWGSISTINFAHGAIFMFSSFASFLLLGAVKLPLVVIILFSIAVGVVLSIVSYAIVISPILRRLPDPAKAELRIVTAGMGIASLLVAFGDKQTGGNPFGFAAGNYENPLFHIAGAQITASDIYILVACVVLTVGIWWWVSRSRGGVALRALGVDPEVASLMGVNRRRTALGVMALSGGLAGLAGALLTFDLGAITPASGDELLIKAFAAVILGGVGSIGGTVLGALTLAIVETLVLSYTSGTWVEAVSFALIFLVLFLRPRGLFGTQEVKRT